MKGDPVWLEFEHAARDIDGFRKIALQHLIGFAYVDYQEAVELRKSGRGFEGLDLGYRLFDEGFDWHRISFFWQHLTIT